MDHQQDGMQEGGAAVSSENVEYHEVTITATKATREGPPGVITLRYALSALPEGWRANFHAAYNSRFLTFRPIATFKDIDRNQIIMTIHEADATEQILGTVRQNLDQAIAAANHKTKTDLAARHLGAQAQQEQAQRDEDHLGAIQEILDKQ
jgi:hypothetical protein